MKAKLLLKLNNSSLLNSYSKEERKDIITMLMGFDEKIVERMMNEFGIYERDYGILERTHKYASNDIPLYREMLGLCPYLNNEEFKGLLNVIISYPCMDERSYLYGLLASINKKTSEIEEYIPELINRDFLNTFLEETIIDAEGQ